MANNKVELSTNLLKISNRLAVVMSNGKKSLICLLANLLVNYIYGVELRSLGVADIFK